MGGRAGGAAAAPAASAAGTALFRLALLLLLLRPRFGPRRLALASELLFELLKFLLHEAARVRVLPVSQLVVPAIRTPLPSFGISFLAG